MTNNKFYNDKYTGGLTNLLCHFLEDTYLPVEEQDDRKTIQKYVSIFDSEIIIKTISNGREVLELTDFPDDWIGETTNRWFENPEKTKSWLINITNTLELEAKKTGKL